MPPESCSKTITSRLPKALLRSVRFTARQRGTSLTGFVRQALVAKLTSQQGLSSDFDRFFEREVGNAVVLLVADGRYRHCIHGQLLRQFFNESLVTLGDRVQPKLTKLILRRDIVAWWGGSNEELRACVTSFERQGWSECKVT